MREITLPLVFRDGSTPRALEARAQKFEIVQGEDVRLVLTAYRENGDPKDLTGLTIAVGISRDPGGDAQIYGFPVLGEVDDAEAGEAHALIYDGDLADQKPGIYYVSVYAYGDTVDWQPLLQSKMTLRASSARPSHTLFARGPAMALVGLPAVTEADVGKVLRVVNHDPLTIEWVDPEEL